MTVKRSAIALPALFVLLLAVWIPACGAQTSSSPSGVTVYVRSREVVLDIVVTDKNGKYVDGLKKVDFTVLEDRVKQQITSFQTPAAHTVPANAPEVRSTADLQKIGDAPVTILVLDELNTQFSDMVYARGALQKWLERQPAKLAQPAVLMAASDEKFAVIHDFTQDRADLLLALKQHFPSYPFRMSKGGSIGPDAGERLALSLGTLMQIAEASSGTPGRKNVIWVGVGFPQLNLGDVTGDKEDEITQSAIRTTNAMLKARVTLNVIDPTAMADSSLDLNNPDYLSLDTLQGVLRPTSAKISGVLNFDTFAPATGGTLSAGRNDVDRAIEQSVSNGSNYYTLAYSPTNHSDDAAKFRNITIMMRDPNLTATTRTGYFPDTQTKPGEKPAPPTTHDLTFDLTSAALSSLIYNGIKVDIHKTDKGYLLQVPRADLRTHVLSDGSNIAEVTVMQVCFGNRDKVLSHDASELRTRIAQDSSPTATVDFAVPNTDIPRGTRRMRFVVRDVISTHIGTTDIEHP